MDAYDVERIIEMTSPEPPKRRFDIDIPSQQLASHKAVLSAIAAELALDIMFYVMRVSFTGDSSLDNRIKLFAGAAGLVAAAITVFHYFLTENMARVIGEELKINEKSYFTCDIDRISCKNDDVRVISGGKAILKLTKYHEGCGELMKWARAYEIPIENNISEPSVKARVLAAAVILAVFAAFIILFILSIKAV